MEFFVSKKFKKMFKKCPPEIQQKTFERLKIFKKDRTSPILNNHALSGKLEGLISINISGDWRVILEEKSGLIILVAIGTHNQLYK